MFTLNPGKRLEIHTLKTYGPNSLNLDNYNRPKTAIIGGVRRIRLSSQSIKYWIRNSELFNNFNKYAKEEYGTTKQIRTRYIFYQIKELINSELSLLGKEPLNYKEKLDEIITALQKLFSSNEKKNGLTHALTLTDHDITSLTEQLIHIEPDNSVSFTPVESIIENASNLDLSSNQCAEIALFGRFTASKHQFLPNVHSPLQVAHAVTTHEANIEKDYFSVVDDLQEKYNFRGAAHRDTRHFSSGVFYAYYCIDIPLLAQNISDAFSEHSCEDKINLTIDLLTAFLYSCLCSAHQGNQTAFANYTLPDAAYLTYGSTFPYSGINAFERPITPCKGGGYLDNSKYCLSEWIRKRYDLYGIFCGPDASLGLGLDTDVDIASLVNNMINETRATINMEVH